MEDLLWRHKRKQGRKKELSHASHQVSVWYGGKDHWALQMFQRYYCT